MNASFPPSPALLKSPAETSVPPKEPAVASISRPVSSAPSIAEKTKTDDFNDLKCTYRDYSHIPAPKNKRAVPSSLKGCPKEPTFPAKLHRILSSQQFRHVITWLPHGRAWKILDQEVFEEQVIPLFFKHGHYSSFARQVNGWGFRRIHNGNDTSAYYHEVSSSCVTYFAINRTHFLVSHLFLSL